MRKKSNDFPNFSLWKKMDEKRRKAEKMLSNVGKGYKKLEPALFKSWEKHMSELPYVDVCFSFCGELLENKLELSEIKAIIENGEIGWNSRIYKTFRLKQEEFDKYLDEPFKVVEGVVKCPKCKSAKTWSSQKQVRRGDEGMTTFSLCVKCNHNWSVST